MKRIITALLFTALLVSSISCASEQTTAETTVAARSVETTAPEEDDYGYVDPELPEKDYDGRAFNILYPEWSLYNNYYFAEEDNGEVVNDALYDRARRVEEYFNIDFHTLRLDISRQSIQRCRRSSLLVCPNMTLYSHITQRR